MCGGDSLTCGSVAAKCETLFQPSRDHRRLSACLCLCLPKLRVSTTAKRRTAGCHERADTASSSLICSQPASQPASTTFATLAIPHLSPHEAFRFFQHSPAGHLHQPLRHATGSFPIAHPPSALPEPHSISLRLHHCTSPTTHHPTHAPW